jgi:S-adenosylmethionine:tRNA ribosyltransferase-isomerase
MKTLDEYDYELPDDLIAQHPLSRRSDARLMIVRRATETIAHAHMRDIREYLNPNDTLVVNDSRVVPAKLVGYRTATGGRWEGLYLSTDEHGLWKIIGRTRGHLSVGDTITLVDREARDNTQLTLVAKLEGGQWAARVESGLPTLELLDRIGRVPLPHYIRGGDMVNSDFADYQTVYAAHPGSVAAPTAGLHFTSELLTELQREGIRICRITLHVGLGTFRPMQGGDIDQHLMHSEQGTIAPEVAEQLLNARQNGGRLIAVGTTTVRTLETAAQTGVLKAWTGETNLFIRPPFSFHATDGLLTNFHLPKSTLLVLVRTFGGDALIKRAYQSAIAEQYRFFSYGDAMLIL